MTYYFSLFIVGITIFTSWITLVLFTTIQLQHTNSILIGFLCAVELFAVILIASFISNRFIKKPNVHSNTNIHDLIKTGAAKTKNYKVISCFSVDEYEDEGPHYFFDIGSNQTLYLNGQYLYDLAANDNLSVFPCSEFEIYILIDSDESIALTPVGIPIPIMGKFTKFPNSYGAKDKTIYSDRKIIDKNFDDVLKSFLN